MNTNELNQIFQSDPLIKRYFVGTFACDLLPSPSTLPPIFSLCVNTDKSTSAYGGLHWQSIFTRNGVCFFFDSFGRPPRGLILKFCKYFPSTFYNKVAHQSPSAITCGAFSIYHIHMQSRGRSFATVVDHFVKIRNDDIFVREWLSSAHNFVLLDATPSQKPVVPPRAL